MHVFPKQLLGHFFLHKKRKAKKTIKLGRKVNIPHRIHVLELFHKISAVGYVISEMKKVTREDLIGATQQETSQHCRAAAKRGEITSCEIDVPRLAFLCDTTARTLGAATSTSALAFNCPTIIIECSFLGADMQAEAEKRGHTWFGGLLPFIKIEVGAQDHKTWVLIHFSLEIETNHKAWNCCCTTFTVYILWQFVRSLYKKPNAIKFCSRHRSVA
jgi:hypothetical protein